MTFEELMVRIGNDGALAGVLENPVPDDQIDGAVRATLESEYSAPSAVVHSLRVQLDKATNELHEADRALADHMRTPPAPSSAFGKLGQRLRNLPVIGKLGQRLGNLPVIRNLRKTKIRGRVFGSKDRSPAAEARDRVQTSLEKRVEVARDKEQQLRERLDTEIKRAEADAETHKRKVEAKKDDWVSILKAEHNSWQRRSRRLCINHHGGNRRNV